MARRLDHFVFQEGTPIRTNPYPLAKWMDGSIWELVRGVDFEGTPRHMQSRLHYYAHSRGKRVQTRTVYEPGKEMVVFRFSEWPEPDSASDTPEAKGWSWATGGEW